MRNKIDRAENSKYGFEAIEMMIRRVVYKLDIFHVNIKTTYIPSIMNDMLVPTDFRFKQNFVIIGWLNRWKIIKAYFYVIITNRTCLTSVSKSIY